MKHSDAPAIIDGLCTSQCSLLNSRTELVTLALGLRPERRFAPLARGICNLYYYISIVKVAFFLCFICREHIR